MVRLTSLPRLPQLLADSRSHASPPADRLVREGVSGNVALVVRRADSSMTKIYTLINVHGEWVAESKPPTFTNDSLSHPIATFILDPKTGAELLPTAEALQAAMRPHTADSKKDTPPHCLWVAVSKRSLRVAANFNGERVAKVELEGEELSEAFYVTRHGQKVLVGITARGSAVVYSMPFLEYITRVDLFYGHEP